MAVVIVLWMLAWTVAGVRCGGSRLGGVAVGIITGYLLLAAVTVVKTLL